MRYAHAVRTILALIALHSAGLHAADKFLGWQSCATSGCHGGGTGKDQIRVIVDSEGKGRDQLKNIHKGKAFGALDIPGLPAELQQDNRYQAIAKALKIEDYQKSAQCTVCHAPMKTVQPELLVHKNPPGDVSCETCHGAAEKWLLTHTRKDVTYAQKVALGMRDLSTPYLRANSCVGCHANLSGELAKAQHPELRFEYARQIEALPPHWRDPEDAAVNWLTGQAVLLRELCWQMEKGMAAEDAPERVRALVWLLRETEPGAKILPDAAANTAPAMLRGMADKLAREASASKWPRAKSRAFFDRLAELSTKQGAEKPDVQMRRAQVIGRAMGAFARVLDAKAAEKHKTLLNAMEGATHPPEKFEMPRFLDAASKLRIALAEKP